MGIKTLRFRVVRHLPKIVTGESANINFSSHLSAMICPLETHSEF